MSYMIDNPDLFLESLINDTWENKLFWDPYNYDNGLVHITYINVKGTKKFLKIEVYDMGRISLVKTSFNGPDNKVMFENIKSGEQRERIQRLILSIKRQQEYIINKM